MRIFTIITLILINAYTIKANLNSKSYITTENSKENFTLIGPGKITPIWLSSSDYKGVFIAAGNLQKDIMAVSGRLPEMIVDTFTAANEVLIIGTLGKSKLIESLISQNRIDTTGLTGRWEKFSIQTIKEPLPGINKATVIIGSDKRGTIYGIYDLSEQIGVSPWYWWADVPVKKKNEIYIIPGVYTEGEPAVKYRGIFINDESPAFRNWAFEKFGGQNHECYEKIFELLLRNKANYLWPAMWLPTIFNEDDTLNPKTADDYGIVMSTSHHEPLMRSHNEWYVFGGGEWNYLTNKDKLREFWRGGVERMGDYESVVTVGMRGDGDDAMSEETAVDLLKEIIADQRNIIADVTGKPANETPQVWAIYKEVQDYYDKGMRVDDDITVLFSDDNWGNIRYLPKEEDLNHPGGYGMYYHFDYVGSPVSYRWLNVTQIERVWEQMNLTYEHGVKNLWIANVGDIKPMELPISFFFDYAWNPDAIQADDLPYYYESWARQQFGVAHSNEIAKLLALYTKYNARRTPEMITPETYSIENYREADRIVEEYKELEERSRKIYGQLPEQQKSAFYQLVLSPIEMCANLNEMYVAAGKNKYYAERGAASANYYADKVKELFERDAELTRYYHEVLENGKWNHMMSQTHIGYTSWAHPPLNKMPAVSYVQIQKPAELGYLLEYGKTPYWGWLDVEADWSFSHEFLPFDPVNNQNYYIDIINRGEEPLFYNIKAVDDWIILSSAQGTTQYNEKIYVSIDWDKAPKGNAEGEILISGTMQEYTVKVPIKNNLTATEGFIENNGVVSIEAEKYTRKTITNDIRFTVIPNLGRTSSSLIIEPVTTKTLAPGTTAPLVEYDFTTFSAAELSIEAFLSPSQDFKKQGGLKYAIAIDNEEPQIINMNEREEKPDWQYANWWTQSVGDHIKIKVSQHKIDQPGKHTLKIWILDPGIVFQKFVINMGGLRPSYLGPPESIFYEAVP
ncbi:MAG: glycosyl hydrolase 115 family protein [Bacteroidales bacterium]|nr:glycosyl hydrolase 115 family protein [Bacteroidales bacterium]MBN2820390.1 glycosyl hydrolase 115 family protein [Bacteroidales bacterium]